MKKLTLNMDDLQVDTFKIEEQSGGRGTVAGHYGTTHSQQGQSCEGTCAPDYTCDYTCEGYMTSPGPEYPCMLCGPNSRNC